MLKRLFLACDSDCSASPAVAHAGCTAQAAPRAVRANSALPRPNSPTSLLLTRPPRTRPPAPQDYHWWWRAYFTSGSSALYLFAYSLFYFYTKLDITKIVPALMYFGEPWVCCCLLAGLARFGSARLAQGPRWPVGLGAERAERQRELS